VSRTTTLAAGGALALSLAVHGAVLAWIAPTPGGTGTPPGGAELSMIGQSFEDLAVGTNQPTTPTLEPTETMQAVTSTPLTPPSSERATPMTLTATAATPSGPRSPSAQVASAPQPGSVTARDVPVAQEPAADTPRPQTRPPPPPGPEPEAQPQTEPAAAPRSTPQGNADRSAQAGTSSGRTEGSATRQQGDTGAAPGPTAREIARYPQEVNRHLSRLRRPNSRFTGMTVVGFTIAGNGGLASISIVRSSGDAAFDDLALQHIRRAVPFPAPPAGAQTSYSVSVRGR
jgi:protein TonB